MIVVRATDDDLSGPTRADLARWGDASELWVPMVYQDEVLGLLSTSEVSAERRYTEDEQRLAAGIAVQAAAALQNARAYERLEQERVALARLNRRLSAFAELSGQMRGLLSEERLIDLLGRVMHGALEFNQWVIYLLRSGPPAVPGGQGLRGHARDRRALRHDADPRRGHERPARLGAHHVAVVLRRPPPAHLDRRGELLHAGRGAGRRAARGRVEPVRLALRAHDRPEEPAHRLHRSLRPARSPAAHRRGRAADRGLRQQGGQQHRAAARLRRARAAVAHRRPDRPVQPPLLPGAPHGRDRPRPALRQEAHAAHDRRRQLQGVQRRLRPPPGRPAAQVAGRSSARPDARQRRLRGALRRRGVRRAAAGDRRGRRRRGRRAATGEVRGAAAGDGGGRSHPRRDPGADVRHGRRQGRSA